MKRFHLHVSVENLDESIQFYLTLFAERPAVQQRDYAKWMLENPRVNFAISQAANLLASITWASKSIPVRNCTDSTRSFRLLTPT